MIELIIVGVIVTSGVIFACGLLFPLFKLAVRKEKVDYLHQVMWFPILFPKENKQNKSI